MFESKWAKDILSVCDNLNVLASKDDYALKLEYLAEGESFSFPLGLWSETQAAVVDGVTTYDITSENGGMMSLDHSIYSEVKETISHMASILKGQITPDTLDQTNYLKQNRRDDFFSK